MKMQELKEVAAERGVKPGKLGKKDLIRKVQEAEGNEQCFSSGKAATCGQEKCLWRPDCD